MRQDRVFSWLFVLLSALPAVSAALPSVANIGQLLQPIFDLIGPGGLYGLYQQSPVIWESIIALVIFVSLSRMTLGQRLPPVIGTVIGVVLAVSFGFFEQKTGFRLIEKTTPIMFAVLLFVFGIFIYNLIEGYFQNRVAAFLIAYMGTWGLFSASGKLLFGSQNQAVIQYGEAFFGIAMLWLVVWGLMSVVKKMRGLTGGGSPFGGGSPIASFSARRRDVDSDVIAAERAAIADQGRQAAQRSAEQAIGEQARSDATAAQQEMASMSGAAKGTEAVTDRLKQEAGALESAARNPQELQEVMRALEAQKDPFNKYVNQLGQVILQLNTRINDKQRVRDENQSQEQQLKSVESLNLRELDTFKRLSSDVQKFVAGMNSSRQTVEKNAVACKEKGIDISMAGAFVDKATNANADKYQQDIKQLQVDYAALGTAAKELQSLHTKVHADIVNRGESRKKMRSSLKSMQGRFGEFVGQINAAISKGDAKELRDAAAKGDTYIKRVQEILEEEKRILENDAAIERDAKALENATAQFKSLNPKFLQDVQRIEKESLITESTIDAADKLLQAFAVSDAYWVKGPSGFGIKLPGPASFYNKDGSWNVSAVKSATSKIFNKQLQTIYAAGEKKKEAAAVYGDAAKILENFRSKIASAWMAKCSEGISAAQQTAKETAEKVDKGQS